MSTPETTLELGRDVTFTTLSGDPIEFVIESIHRGVEADDHLTAHFRLDGDTWSLVSEEGWFHLDVGQYWSFDPDKQIDVRARLRPGLAAGLSESSVEIAERFDDPDDLLCQTESWYATEVTQDMDLSDDSVDFDEMTGTVGNTTRWEGFFEPAEDFSVTDTVTDFLEDVGWEYEYVREDMIHFTARVDDQRLWPVFVYFDEAGECCLIYSIFPAHIPVQNRGEAAVVLAGHNYDLNWGAFEMDPADGEVRFRHGVMPKYESFEAALQLNIETMEMAYDDISTFVGGPSATDSTVDTDHDPCVEDLQPRESDAETNREE